MINKKILINFFDLLNQKAKDYYEDFNSIDGQLGDGDLGITITKGIEEICNNKEGFEEDMGKNFLLCSKLFTKVSSSSFGTLTSISFFNLAKLYKNKKEISKYDIILGLEKIIEAISVRGKSKIGDKTALDTLNEIVNNLKLTSNEDLGFVVNKACIQSLINFKGRECKIGRARMYAEKSKNL